MPYVVREDSHGGGTVYNKDTGRKVGHTKNIKRYMSVLARVERGEKVPHSKHRRS